MVLKGDIPASSDDDPEGGYAGDQTDLTSTSESEEDENTGGELIMFHLPL
jgi:hypothetical protein